MLINGTAGNDTLLGTALEDEIYGLGGNDDLDGKAGTDLLVGADGDDTYRVDDPEDAVVEREGEGRDQIIATAGIADTVFALSDQVEDLVLAGTLATDGAGNGLDNRLTGNGAVNLLVGGAGNDTLDGGAAADVLAGGVGDDVYLADLADEIVEGDDEGTDTVQTSVSYTLPENVERLVLIGAAPINGTGNELDNSLTGNAAANRLDGAAGNDTLEGGGGNDTYVVDSPDDAVLEAADGGTDAVEASASFILPDQVERLTLTGTADIDATGNGLANTLTGNTGGNRLDGGAGNDTLAGGAGDDTYVVDAPGDLVTEIPLAGMDTVRAAIAYALPLNVENLVLTGTASTATGNAMANNLAGNDAANTLDGGAGNDTLVGGGGNDLYLIDAAGDQVVEATGGGDDTARATATWILPANVENLALQGTAAIDGTGNALDNRLAGNANNNRLDGAAGADTLEGGAGNDTYVIDSTGDLAIETSGGGTNDVVEAGRDYQLPDFVERLILTGTADLDGWGNNQANYLTGNAGANRLDGGASIDTMAGGAGDDTYVVNVAGDQVLELAGGGDDTVITTTIYALPAQVENLVLAGDTAIHGTGNVLPNRITGNDAGNILDGGAGADILIGGSGNDTYVVDMPADRIVELPDGGIDTVRAGFSLVLPTNVEALILTRGGLTGTGNALDNIFSDLAGNNTFAGGAGNDTYYLGATDKVVELAGNGNDTVIAPVSLALPAEVENLTLTGLALRGTGNTLPNVLTGNTAANTLTGGAGNDTLDGGPGNDVLAGGAGDDLYVVGIGGGQDRIVELDGEGVDTVRAESSFSLAARPYVEHLTLAGSALAGTGNTLANLLTGNNLGNTLSGGAGNDTLAGQGGADSLAGGTGADLFRYGQAADSTVAAPDTLGDFTAGADRIEFAGMISGYNPAPYAWSGSVAATVAAITADGAKADHLVFFSDGTDGWLYVNGPGFGTSFDGALVKLVGRPAAPEAADILGVLPGTLVNGTDGDDALAGTSAADVISGRGGNDTLDGLAGNDTLVGGTGNDQMAGGPGDDTYFVDSTDDTAAENGAEGTDLVQATVTYALADPDVENLTLTGSAAIDGTGNASANVLAGNSGANVLDGMGGADTMAGGAGNDTYVVDDAGDTVHENPGEGTDVVQASVSYGLSDPDVENLVLTGSADLGATGNGNPNALDGNSGNNLLSGGAGNDTLAGGSGADTLDGGTGADVMAGGADGDIYLVDDAGDTVTEIPGGGIDQVRSSVSFALPDDVEHLSLTGSAALVGIGNGLANEIDGNDAANSLYGGAGSDVLMGNAGEDTLDGGAGGDAMNGGAGNDTYQVDNPGDSVDEGPGGGTDSLITSVSYDLPAEVEVLTLAGIAAIDGAGNDEANVINGNGAANVLTGRGGADTLAGGGGTDSFRYAGSSDSTVPLPDTVADFVSGSDRVEFVGMGGVGYSTTHYAWAGDVAATVASIQADAGIVDRVVHFTNELDGWLYVKGAGLGTNFDGTLIRFAGLTAAPAPDDLRGILTGELKVGTEEGDVLTGTSTADALYGLGGNDTIYGLSGNDVLTGGGGNDSLDGGTGGDDMLGGIGDDVYVVGSADDQVDETGGDGTDTVLAGVDFTLPAGVERLTQTGYGNIAATGNALANVLNGNDGDNTLDGGAGADAMFGGLGNDTYVVDDPGDAAGEDSGKGMDLVLAGISFTLPDNVERLTLTGTDGLVGAGNALDNAITGNAAGNALTGGAGNDTLDGGAGADTLNGGAGNDLFIIDGAADVVSENTGEGDDTISAPVSYALTDPDVENLVLTGAAPIMGTGNAGANRLTGNDGDNTLDGGAGADTLAGGKGNDVYFVDDAGDAVQESAAEGEDTIVTMVDGTLAGLPAVENLQLSDAEGNLAFTGGGNALDNRLTGNARGNTLNGLDGNDTLLGGATDNPADHDTLDGGAGTDSMAGGSGNDVYYVDNAGDVVLEAAGAGRDTVRSAINYALGAELEDLVLTGAALTGNGNALDNRLTGNALANVLTGLAGNDTLDGAAGNDSMTGGTGNDAYYVDQSGDLVTENASGGTDTVIAGVFYTLADKPNLENLTLTGSDVNLTGNAAANVLTGNGANNLVDGGAGADTMAGGNGNDIYLVDNAADVVSEESDTGGTDEVRAAVTYGLAANVEALVLTGTGSTSGTGNGLANLLTGNAGNNTLDGGAGADTLAGGAGNDTYVIDNAGDQPSELAGEGTDTVLSSISFSIAGLPAIEHVTLAGTGNIDATGNAGANVLTGNTGNNLLDGGSGNDTMAGGSGNDTYLLDAAGDAVIESADGGTDTIVAPFAYSLAAIPVENLTLTGTGNINGTGNASPNVLTGNNYDNVLDGGGGPDQLVGQGGNDTLYGGGDGDYLYGMTENDLLDGGAGNDTMEGGAGNDTYYVDAVGDIVSEFPSSGFDVIMASVSFTTAADVEKLVLTGTSNINASGNAAGNQLVGNAGNNQILGLEGNDTLDGGAGNDNLRGGTGDDTYVIDSAGDSVIEDTYTDGGYDTVQSYVNQVLGANLERLLLMGTGHVNGTGNELDNYIVGNSGDNSLAGGTGNDTLLGGAGNDTLESNNGGSLLDVRLQGGTGNDTYIIHERYSPGLGGAQVIEQPGEGVDTVESTIDYWGLDAEVENLTLVGAALSARGNSLPNLITGNVSDNFLRGDAGADTLVGGLGNDNYYVEDAGDVVTETGAGTDKVTAAVSYTLPALVEDLSLDGAAGINGTGNELANRIDGNDGNNVLDGKGGADTLAGGLGDDTYVIDNAGDRVVDSGAGTDLIQSSVACVLPAPVENLTLTGSAAIGGTGNASANQLIGNAANNALDGRGGEDSVSGGGGQDLLRGGYGNDTLDGGGGADTLAGGAGNDVYAVDDTGDRIVENADLTLASWSSDHGQGSGASQTPSLSADAQRVVFESAAAEFDGNALKDVFVLDSVTGALTKASRTDTGLPGNGNSFNAAISADGRYVVFSSDATNLEGVIEFEGHTDVFRKDLQTGALDTVSRYGVLRGNGDSDLASISNDGNLVAFASAADNLIPAGEDSNGAADIFVKNMTNGSIQRVSTSHLLNGELSGDSTRPTLSGDGNVVAFDHLVSGHWQIDVKYRDTGVLLATAGNGDSYNASISADGNYVAFSSLATNLVAGDANGKKDVVVLNLSTGTFAFASTAGDGSQGNGDSSSAAISSDGRYVTFASDASNLVAGDTNGTTDIFRKDMVTGAIVRLSAAVDGTQGNGASDVPAISADGRYVAFQSAATNLAAIDGNGATDIFLADTGLADDPTSVDSVNSSVSLTLPDGVEHLTLTGSAATGTGNTRDNLLTGNASANTLDGLGGNDTLDGGGGIDTMRGGPGNDVFIADNAADIASENPGEGADQVYATASYAISDPDVENLALAGTGSINGTGNANPNVLTGNSGANVLDGLGGADTMTGGAGNDTYVVDNGGDVVNEEAGEGTDAIVASVTYTLVGRSVENLTLSGTSAINGIGNELNNVLTGNGGANILFGGAGADTMAGGAGNDTYSVDDAGDVLSENAGEGTDLVQASVTYAITDPDVENLTLVGAAAINGTGNASGNVLTGNGAANVLDGLGGADTLAGGADNDTYVVDNAADVVNENAAEGTDLVQASVTYAITDPDVENLTLVGASAINGTGNASANLLTGNGAANVLDGLGGADTLAGGAGNDTYGVDNAADVVNENAGDGTDLVQASVTYAITDPDVENLTLIGAAAINGTGNASANLLTGNGAANVLDGLGGADTLAGGAGNDTYVVDNAADVVSENAGEGTDLVQASVTYAIADADVENLTLTGAAAIDGTGNVSANVLTGNGAANVLDGLGGADTLAGGAGNDTYVVDNIADTISENTAEGTDLVLASVNYTITDADVENLTLTGTTNLKGTGNGSANVLTGNNGANSLSGGGGDDTLDGGTGLDTLVGGAGDDWYYVDNAGDTVSENAGEGTDLVRASVTYTLSNIYVENLTLTGSSAIDGTGNKGDNKLVGTPGPNVLSGAEGSDSLSGGSGNDTLYGGTGNDTLTGGSGADGFVFNTTPGSTNADDVTDFTPGTDVIGLENAIFTTLAAGVLPATAFYIGTAAHDASDRIIYNASTGALYYDPDGNTLFGDSPVLFATLDRGLALAADDFGVI